MKITVNKKEMEVSEGLTLKELLELREIAPKGVATAVNGDVVRGDDRGDYVLQAGDAVVIISAFYGG